jgi:hypothetical protein
LTVKRTLFSTTAALCLLFGAVGPASALTIIPTDDAFALANTLFLNTPALSITSANLRTAGGSSSVFQAGTCSNASGVYGLPNIGIALSSGNISNYAEGPNTDSGFTTGIEVLADEDQQDLLEPITEQSEHYDVAQMDIDFFNNSAAGLVTFFATFGSEEFPEYVGSEYIDGFGLYVNGVNVAGVLQSGGVAGDLLEPVNINHPDMTSIAGTELDGILAPNGKPVLRFDVPIVAASANIFSIILADASDAVLDTTVYLSSFFAQDTGGGDDGGGFNNGESEFQPILPSNPPNPETGAFDLVIPDDVPVGTTVWVDPPVAVGYSYQITGSAFATFTAPSLATIADLDGYFLNVGMTSVPIAAGQTINFFSAFGVNPTAFTLTGINPSLGLDPLNTLAFPSGVSFTTITGSVVVTMTPITAPVPLPASVLMSGSALALLAGLSRRRRKTAA